VNFNNHVAFGNRFDFELVVKRERHSERVKARSEVCRRGWYSYRNFSTDD
jgi:hypothetical protein